METVLMANDPVLGKKIQQYLIRLGVETPMVKKSQPMYKIDDGEAPDDSRQQIADHVFDILQHLGLNLGDDSLKETPQRVAKMYCEEIFMGLDYDNFPKCTTVENKFNYDEVVLVRNNIVRSTCEHHLQPIYGRASIAYIPGKRVLGLSKFARVVDFFASRPQVQERLTEQIYAALSYILQTDDIAVVMEADHFCMKMRGVEEYCSDTVTSKMGGRFRTESDARHELLSLIKVPK